MNGSIISGWIRGKHTLNGGRLRKMATNSATLLVHCYRMDMFAGMVRQGVGLEVMDREHADIFRDGLKG